MPNANFYEHFFHIFLEAEIWEMQTVSYFPLHVHSTNNFIISSDTLDELVEIIELQLMNFFKYSQ